MTAYTTYSNLIPGNLTALVVYDQTVTGGLFSPFLLFIIFVTTFLILYGKGNENALVSAATVTTISSIMLLGVGAMPLIWVFVSIVINLISIFSLPKER